MFSQEKDLHYELYFVSFYSWNFTYRNASFFANNVALCRLGLSILEQSRTPKCSYKSKLLWVLRTPCTPWHEHYKNVSKLAGREFRGDHGLRTVERQSFARSGCMARAGQLRLFTHGQEGVAEKETTPVSGRTNGTYGTPLKGCVPPCPIVRPWDTVGHVPIMSRMSRSMGLTVATPLQEFR